MSEKQKHVFFLKGIFNTDNAKRKALMIMFLYFLFGCAWIISSDILAEYLIPERFNIIIVSMAKGLLYVAVTAFLMNRLVYSALKKLTDSEATLREREVLFRAIFEQAPIGIAVGLNDKYVALSDQFPGINPMFEKLTGRAKEQWFSTSWSEYTHPDEMQADRDYFEKFNAGEIKKFDVERRFLKPDGSEVWLHVIATPLIIENNKNYNYIHLIQDITARKHMEQALNESERSKGVLLENLPGIAYRCNNDRQWTMQFISHGCYELTGYKPESLIGNREKSFNDIISPKYREYIWEKWAQALKAGEKYEDEYELITSSGEVKWVLEQGQGVYDKDGNIVALEGLIIDITDRKEQELTLLYLSEHDMLTGLYNRGYFETLLVQAGKTNGKRAVVLMDLKKMNFIHLTYGYDFGEKLLKELAASLSLLTRDDCKLFQISCERFAFLINGYKNRQALSDFCDNIFSVMRSMQLLHIIGCGIGVLEFDSNSCDPEHIIRNASIAAEGADEHQTFGHRFFEDDLKAKINRETVIKEELMIAALVKNNHNLFLLYQPIIDLKTNQIKGFEALARLKSEKLGIVSPAEFIPIAEEMLLIVPIGHKVIRMACVFLKKLEAAGYDDIKVAVNISAIQLLRDEFLDDLIQIIEDTQIITCNLGFEITESVFSENYEVINGKLELLKGMGMRISIDDFGTGYSSLARERELNVNCLKIDKYFIDNLLFFNSDEAITGDIISIAHKLGHCVVAEGVECEKQKQYLIAHNCDLVQGYLFSKPLEPGTAVELLKNELLKK